MNDVLKKEHYWQRLDDHQFCLINNNYDLVNEREVFSARIMEGGKEEVEVGYNIRLYSLPELKKMLDINGFELVQYWGDFDKNDYSIHSRRLITLWRKI